MKNQILAIFSIMSFFSILLYGCAEPEETAGESLTGPIAELQGTWVTGCNAYGVGSVEGTFTVSGTNISEKSTHYSDKNCKSTDLKVDSTYNNLRIGEKITHPDGLTGYRATYVVQSIENTPLSASQTSTYNNPGGSSYCGVSWVISTPIDILGRNCSGITTPKNSTMFNLYKLTGNNIYLGTPDPTNYPGAVNTIKYVKQ